MVWIPKYRRKSLYEQLRKHLGPVLRELARQKESMIEEGHLMPDHVHMLISHIGNELFSWFESISSKSRINFLKLLRSGHTDYAVNADAVSYCELNKLPRACLNLFCLWISPVFLMMTSSGTNTSKKRESKGPDMCRLPPKAP